MGRATANFCLASPPGVLGRGQKVKYHLISITKSISKIFIPNVVCFLTKKIQTISDGIFYSVPWVMPQERGFRALGCQGGQKFSFFKHGHVAYQIDGDEEQNRMKVQFNFHPRVKLVTLGLGQKVKY